MESPRFDIAKLSSRAHQFYETLSSISNSHIISSHYTLQSAFGITKERTMSERERESVFEKERGRELYIGKERERER